MPALGGIRGIVISQLTAGYWQNGCCPVVRLVGWLVGKSCLSRVACLSACGRGPPGPSVSPCVSTTGEVRQRRVYNTKEVCYTC